MRNDVRERLEAIDGAIRAAKIPEAVQNLERLVAAPLPDEALAEAARLSWRVDRATLGMKLLYGRVRQRHPVPATVAEAAEYAACLVRVGAYVEAGEILEKLPAEEYPPVRLYQTFALFNRWEYRAAIPLLRAYLDAPLDDYARIVGTANLASALVYERKALAAGHVLRELVRETSVRKLGFLQGTALRLAAVSCTQEGRFEEGEKYLAAARTLLGGTDTQEAFLVRKWEVLLLLRKAGTKGPREVLAPLREEARRRGHWETLRDADRYEAVVFGDEAILRRTYFGTPYESFRDRLLRDFPKKAKLPDSYRWAATADAVDEIDLAAEDGFLEAGSVPHRLLATLAKDFYQPFRTATLFFELFPGEYFNPEVSPRRVHEAVRRLRELLAERNLALAIASDSIGYALVPSATVAVRVRPSLLVDADDRALQRLREAFPDGFGARDAEVLLGDNRRTVQRLLKRGLERERLRKSGAGPATRYRFGS